MIVMQWTAPLLSTYMEGLNAEFVQGGLAVKQNNITIHHVPDHCVAKLQLACLLISVAVLQKPVISGQFTSVRVCCTDTHHTSKTCHKWSVYQCESVLCTYTPYFKNLT